MAAEVHDYLGVLLLPVQFPGILGKEFIAIGNQLFNQGNRYHGAMR